MMGKLHAVMRDCNMCNAQLVGLALAVPQCHDILLAKQCCLPVCAFKASSRGQRFGV